MRNQIFTYFLIALTPLFLACEDEPNDGDFMGPVISCDPPDIDLFVLPFSVGSSFTLVQGPCGAFSHQGNVRFAFDFAMPIGTPVVAAMGGVVNYIEEGYTDGDAQVDHFNVVTISHDDGTFGRYMHLTQDGALVEPGMMISRGDTIGLSGNTGFVSEPQLHFDVVKCLTTCDMVETQPIGFLNADKPVVEVNASYTANPY